MQRPHDLSRSSLVHAAMLFAAILLCPGVARAVTEPVMTWDQLAEGLALAVWTPPSPCPDLSPFIVLKIDPARYRFSVHHYQDEPVPFPPDIQEWQAITGHDVVFNAGLFRENYAYLGLLYGKGEPLGSKRHSRWMGLFVAEPTKSDSQAAGILDLAVDRFDEERPSYREAAQSLMLLDRTGKIRVKQTGKRAQQTILAEQDNGHILLLKTTSVTSLYAIGQCLRDVYPSIRHAMAMDGGSSSDLSIRPALRLAAEQTPGLHAWASLLNSGPTGHIGLPAVIGISPRQPESNP